MSWDAGNTVALIVASMAVAGNVLVTRWNLGHQRAARHEDHERQALTREEERGERAASRWLDTKREAYADFAQAMERWRDDLSIRQFRLFTAINEKADVDLEDWRGTSGVPADDGRGTEVIMTAHQRLLMIRLLAPPQVHDAAFECWRYWFGVERSSGDLARSVGERPATDHASDIQILSESWGTADQKWAETLDQMSTDLRK